MERRVARCWPALVAICMPSWLASASGAGSEDLQELALSAHRAAVESIRSLSCTVSVYNGTNVEIAPPQSVGRYVRDGNAIRVSTTIRNRFLEIVVKDGVNSTLNWSKSAKAGDKDAVVKRVYSHEPLGQHDAWVLALISLPAGKGQVRPLSDLVREPANASTFTRVQEDGHTYVLAEVSVNEGPKLKAYLDPLRNYMICRLKNESKSGNGARADYDVKSFAESAPGVFFPTKMVVRYTMTEEWATTFLLGDLVVNRPVRPNAFDLRFPDNVDVFDQLEGRIYRADSSGKYVGESKLKLVKTTPLVNKMGLESTKEESLSGLPWLRAACLVMVIVGSGALLARRYLRAK